MCWKQWANFVRARKLPFGASPGRSDPALWRRVAAALVFFSFFWISYVSQTHIHGQPVSAGVVAGKLLQVGANAAKVSGKQHNPDDPADCPLCQAVSLGGIAIVPLLITLVVLLQNIVRLELPKVTRAGPTNHLGYAHQTRGPPGF